MQFRDHNQARGKKSLDILEKAPKMYFEEKIVPKYVFTFLGTKTCYWNIQKQKNKKQETVTKKWYNPL